MLDGILYCLNLNWALPFWVRSRSPDTFKMMLCVTTLNNSSQGLPIFGHGKLHLRCSTGCELNIVTWSTKILKGIGGTPTIECSLGKIEILTLLDVLKIHSQRFFALRFIELTKWSYQLIDVRRFYWVD